MTPDAVAERVDELREANPMLGHRGCRLGMTDPGDHRDAGARDLPGGAAMREPRASTSSRRS